MSEDFQKTPKKADRWFRLAIVFALLYGITFSLYSIFNWIFFLASGYSFFMSYYLLPVQPSIFQGRPKPQQNWGGQASAQRQNEQILKRVIFMIGAGVFVLFMFFFVKGFVQSIQEEATQPESSEETSEVTAAENIAKGDDFFNASQYDSAEVYYVKALDREPDNVQAMYGKGIVLWQTDRKDEAMTMFRRSYDGGNRFWWLSWVLADASDKEGNAEQAISLYKESLSMDSTCTECYTRLAVLEPANGAKYLELSQKHPAN